MRKFLLFIGLMVFSTIIFAQATATLRAGSTDLTGIVPGDKIYLPIIVDAKSNNLVTGYQFFIDYDHSVMSWDGTISNPLPGVSYFHPNFAYTPGDYLFNDNGTAIIVSFVDGTWNGKVVNPGETLITFKFTYLGGETDLIWETEEKGNGGNSGKYITEMYDENFDFYTLTLINGCVCFPNFDITLHATENGIDLAGVDITIGSETLTTDVNGNAMFSLANGTYTYLATKAGYYNKTGSFTVSGANQTVEVPMSLLGSEFDVTFVVTSGGNPLQGATVMVGSETAITNVLGEAIISLPNGNFNYSVSKYGYSTETGSFVVSGAPLTIPVSLTMLPQYSIIFHVTSGGFDLSGALVNIPNVGSILTDINGEAIFNMIDGTYAYTVTKTGYSTATGSITVTGAAMVEEVVLAQLYDITFHVTDGTANIAGASVTIGSVTKTTNASGNAVFSLSNGNYNYLVTKSGYVDVTGMVTVADANQTIEITMNLVTYPVTFHVTSDGSNIEGALIIIDTYTASTNINGIAVFNLPDGSYFYSVSKLGFYEEVGNFDVTGAAVAVNVTLNPYYYDVTFHVTSGGVNLQGAVITIGSQSITTNTAGNAIFSLTNGTYSYTVTKLGYNNVTGTFTVNNANQTIEIVMELTLWTVTFQVTSAGVNLEGALVLVGTQSVTTDINGIAVFTLPDGDYTYSVTKTGYVAQTGSFTVAGANLTIPVNMPVMTYATTFHCVQGGVGLAGVDVTCNGQTITTDANGDAVFMLPNGTYDYTAQKFCYNTATGTVTVNGAAQTKTVIMTLQQFAVTFVVTHNAEPIPGASVTLAGVTQLTGDDGTTVFMKVNGTYNYSVTHPDYGGPVTGTVTVNCAPVTETIQLVGVYDITSGSFNVYPNPSNGTFSITTTAIMGYESNVTVYDLAGKPVYTGKLEGNDVNVIDLSGNGKGMYIMQIIVEGKVYNKTLVIQ